MAENLSNDFTTTLNGGIDGSTTALNVASSTGSPAANFRIRVDDELMLVTSKGTGLNWTVTRNVEGTTPVAHSNGATVAHVITEDGLENYLNERYARLDGATFTGAVTLSAPLHIEQGIALDDTDQDFSYSYGTVATGTVRAARVIGVFTGDSGGATSFEGFGSEAAINGANAVTLVTAGNFIASNAAAVVATNVTGVRSSADVSNAGGSATNLSAYDAPAPGYAGTVTTARQYRTRNWGHATKVTSLHCFDAIDQTACATITTAFHSTMSSGTGKWAVYAEGTAASLFGGDVTVTGDIIGNVKIGTPINTTSGTVHDFAIPAGAVRVTINFLGVGAGTTDWQIQLGDSGGIETTGYTSEARSLTGGTSTTSTTGLVIVETCAGAETWHGRVTLELISGFTWVATSTLHGTTTGLSVGAGSKTLSAELSTVRLTAGGVTTFDAGQINITYER